MARRDEPDDPDDDDAPRRKQDGKRSQPVPIWVWLLLCGFVFMVLAAGGAGVLIFVAWNKLQSDQPTEVAGTNSPGSTNANPSSPGTTPKRNSLVTTPTRMTPDPDAELKRNAKDLKEYTDWLKSTVPYDMKKFTDAGFKAESYKKDPKREWFTEVVLKVEPVYLTDKITGETKKYTKAKMVRNNPAPASVNSRGGITSVPVPFAWESITMLP